MFEFSQPWIFTGLLLPFLIFLLPKTKVKINNALKLPFYNDVVQLIDAKNSKYNSSKKLILPFIIWSLLICALADPKYVGEPEPVTRDSYKILLALDISASMSWADMSFQNRPISRIEVVKRAATNFVKERTTDKIGLILFGTRAYLQTPLTFDHQNVLMRIKDATVGLAGNATSIGDALGLAIKRLQEKKHTLNAAPVPSNALNNKNHGKIIILLTDGANTAGILSPLKAAEMAKSENIKIYTIGLGASSNPYTVGGLALNANNDLDETTLQEVARITAGKYFKATDPKSLQEIYHIINKLEVQKNDSEVLRPEQEFYYWLTTLGLILFFIWLIKINGLRLNNFNVFRQKNMHKVEV